MKPGPRIPSSRAAAGSRRNKRLKTVPTRKSDWWGVPDVDHWRKPDHQARALNGGIEGIRNIFLKAIQPIAPKGTHEH